MSIAALDHINMRLSAPVLAKVRDFYVDMLGLVVGDRPPFRSSGYWLYSGKQPLVHLVEDAAIDPATANQSDVVEHMAFRCSDYDGMLARLEAAGIACDLRNVPGSPERQIFLRDPAGVHIELIFD